MTQTPLETIALMDTRTKLMLIDQIADTLGDDIADELSEGLAAAFERAELGFSGVHTPIYPAGSLRLGVWTEWRSERDRAINAFLRLYGRVAA